MDGKGEFLRHYDFDYIFALIKVGSIPGIQQAFLGSQLQIGPHSQGTSSSAWLQVWQIIGCSWDSD